MVKALNYGRCGNVFFQVACAIGYAKKNGLDFSVQSTTNSDFWNPLYLQHLVNPAWDESKERIIIKEKNFHYDELEFNEDWRSKNIILDGYFQSFRYYQEYREEVLDAFNLHWELMPDVCAIHARYGDYLTIVGKHIIVDEEYILKAMKLVSEKTGITRFKVFSDDIPLFKQRHGDLFHFEYSTNTDIMADLIEASCCHSLIGSSSTFSYWIAELNRNPDKVKTVQSKWFVDGWTENGKPYNTYDLLDDKWIKL